MSFVVLFSWCTMIPSDEEIIKWSILENEIFWDKLSDDNLNVEELLDENEEWINDDEDLDISDENDDWDVEIQIEVVN